MRSHSKHVIAIIVVVISMALVTPMVCVAGSGLGVKVGLTFTKQDFSFSDPVLKRSYGYHKGIGGGLFIERQIVPLLSVRAEGMYIQKEFQINIHDGMPDPIIGDIWLVYRTDYLSFDLVGKVTFPSGTYVLAGPRFDLKLSTKESAGGRLPQELEDKFAASVFGWTLGAGQSFPLTPKFGFFVEGELYLDQGNLYDKSKDGITSGSLETIKNKSFALFVGVRF